ncbi:MAG: GyrI-like domain-containing protein [Uliginosibacterium sp.]|nr:GyrI-like domain-containing protein [Uliginosibacterium sp.]
MFTEPKIDTRAALPYLGIRRRVSMGEFGPLIPEALDQTMAWLDAEGIQADGPPLIRYHACPTECGAEAFVDVCVGWPLAKAVSAPEGFEADTLPAGRYASLVFTGVENGMAGNGVLIDWARAQGLQGRLAAGGRRRLRRPGRAPDRWPGGRSRSSELAERSRDQTRSLRARRRQAGEPLPYCVYRRYARRGPMCGLLRASCLEALVWQASSRCPLRDEARRAAEAGDALQCAPLLISCPRRLP